MHSGKYYSEQLGQNTKICIHKNLCVQQYFHDLDSTRHGFYQIIHGIFSWQVADADIIKCSIKDDFPNKVFMNAKADKTVGDVDYLNKK